MPRWNGPCEALFEIPTWKTSTSSEPIPAQRKAIPCIARMCASRAVWA